MAIARAGAVEPLVDLLRHGTAWGSALAATALRNLGADYHDTNLDSDIGVRNEMRIACAVAIKPLVSTRLMT